MGCGGGFGSGGFGSMPYGSGSALHVISATAIADNAIRVLFAGIPQASDPATVWDALRPSNWDLVPIDPTDAIDRLVVFVQRATESELDVYVDGPLDPLATYRVVVSAGVRADSGSTIPSALDCRSAEFDALGERPVPVPPRVAEAIADGVDLANPQTAEDAPGQNAPLGTFQRTAQGDLATEHGRAYLRKRITRRVISAVGSFFHLPSYGLGQRLKATIRPDYGRRLAAEAREQIRQEPGVLSVSVTPTETPERPELVLLTIRVRDRWGGSLELGVPVLFGG